MIYSENKNIDSNIWLYQDLEKAALPNCDKFGQDLVDAFSRASL